MIHIPGPIAGVDGINYTARQIRKWRDKLGPRKVWFIHGQIVYARRNWNRWRWI